VTGFRYQDCQFSAGPSDNRYHKWGRQGYPVCGWIDKLILICNLTAPVRDPGHRCSLLGDYAIQLLRKCEEVG
jgi:hypothetical protein